MVEERHPLPGSARSMSRRLFFKVVGVAGGALLAAGGGVAAWLGWVLPAPLVRSSFTPRLGDTFQVQADSAPLALQLVKIEAGPAAVQPSAASEQSFGLLFRGPADQPLRQGTYEFAHGRIGRFPLFIVPMAAEPGARYYQAIFNRQHA